MTKRKSGMNTSNEASSTAVAVISRASAGTFFRYTPLSALFRSEYNVRKTGPLVDVPELADLIAAQDVLQNLVVYDEKDADGNPTGRSGVVAGGRRHGALLYNVERGLHGMDKLVPTLVADEERAVEYSLAENQRAPMHPADEYDAFKAMADNGLSIEEIAARFGIEPIIVKRRLKLANVAPEFITMYRKESIELDHLMELARIDSHEEQRRVWKSLGKHQRGIYWLRNAVNAGKLSLTDKKVKFVGVKAYEAAGGLVFRDIFADDEQGSIADPVLLNTLVNEKLENKRDELKETEGWAYVEIVDSIDYSTEKSYHETFKVDRAATTDEANELAKLAAKAETLREKLAEAEDAGDEKRARKLNSQLETVSDSEAAIREALVVEDAEQRAIAGAIIAVGDNGKLKVLRNMLKMADYTRFRRAADRMAAKKAAVKGGQGGEASPPVVRAYSESLVRRLTAHRTLALQVEVARRPDIALAAMVAAMVEQHYENGSSGPGQVRLTEASLDHHIRIPAAAIDYDAEDGDEAIEPADEAPVPKSPAEEARDELHQEIDALLADAGDDVFAYLLTRPQDELLRLQGFFFALSIHAVRSREDQEDTAAPLAKAVGLNMAKWWTPTADSLLSSISKAQLLSIVSEQGAVADLPQLSKLKVRDLVTDVEARLSGQNWLPSVLRSA